MKKNTNKVVKRALVMIVCCLFFSMAAFAQPTITSFTPTAGQVGAIVSITGTNFNTTATNNIVIFGATRATVTAATAMQLTVTVPVGATYAPITVLDATTGLLGYSSSNFTPTFSPNKGSIAASDFDPKMDFATGAGSFSVATGDLDGDGKADLAVANRASNTVSVFRNTGSSGAVSYSAGVDFATGAEPYTVAIGDLDGDGKADLAVANLGSSTVSVFRNTGSSGTITSSSYAAKVDFATGANPRFVAIGDLDGDGRPDLAVANHGSSSVSVFRNTSSIGALSYTAKVDFTADTNPNWVAVGDLDGDGKADLAVVNYSANTVSVFHNTGSSGSISSSSYAPKVDFATGAGPYSVGIGDLDSDGKADLTVANSISNTVSIFRNTGSSGSLTTSSYAAKVDFATGSIPRAIAIGDLDGDSKADLAVTNSNSNTASIFRNVSSSGSITSSSFATKVDFATGLLPFSAAIGDLDGDGKADLTIANYGGNTVSVFRNNPVFPPTITSLAPASGAVGTTVTVTGTNFNTTATNNIVIFGATRATVTAATATQLTVTVPVGATYAPITVLDAATGLLAYSTSNFTPTFSPNKGSITTADFNPKVDFATGTGPFSVALGDLDGDGKADLAVANRISNTVSVFRNTGSSGSITSASYDAKVDLATGASPRAVA